MLIITLIALVFGGISILFIASEINESIDNFLKLSEANRGLKKITLLWKWPGPFKRLAMDVAITIGIIWLFSMGGMMGMIVSLLCSGIISGNLWIRKRRKKVTNKAASR